MPEDGAIGPRQVAELVGQTRKLGILDVAAQRDARRMSLLEFAEYWEARKAKAKAKVRYARGDSKRGSKSGGGGNLLGVIATRCPAVGR